MQTSIISRFRDVIHNPAPLLLDDPPVGVVQEAAQIIHPDDAPILAAARRQSLDYFATTIAESIP